MTTQEQRALRTLARALRTHGWYGAADAVDEFVQSRGEGWRSVNAFLAAIATDIRRDLRDVVDDRAGELAGKRALAAVDRARASAATGALQGLSGARSWYIELFRGEGPDPWFTSMPYREQRAAEAEARRIAAEGYWCPHVAYKPQEFKPTPSRLGLFDFTLFRWK